MACSIPINSCVISRELHPYGKTVSKSLRMDDWNVYLFLFVGCVYRERGFAIDYVDENSQRTTLYMMVLMGYLIY